MKKIKICMITDDPNEIGGGPEHIRHISKILTDKHNVSATIVTPRTMDLNFRFENIFHRVKYLFWLVFYLVASNFDIYHSHSFSTSLILPIAKIRRKKIGITVHGMGFNLVGAGIINRTNIFKLLANLVLNHWPFDFRLSASDLAGFETVGNGVDLKEFARLNHKSGKKQFTILCISRRDPVKGVELLEKAIKEIPSCKLNLVTGRKRKLEDFESADCYVLPSLSEGLPLVLLEAMAAKLPIITTDVGDCGKLVKESKSGFVIAPGSINAIRNSIKIMMKSRTRKRMGLNGYEYVKKKYTWDKVAEETYNRYREK